MGQGPEDVSSITSQSNVVSILCNINVLRHEDIGDMAAMGMSLTRAIHEK